MTDASRTGRVPASGVAAGTPAPFSSRRQLTGWLLTRTRNVLAPLAVSILMRCIALVTGAAIIGFAAYAATGALGTPVPPSRIAVVLIVLSLLKALTRYLEQFFGHLVAFKALSTLRVYFYDRLEPQAPAATEGRRTGDLLSRATRDIDRIEVFFAHTLGPALTAVVVPVGLLCWVGAVSSWTVAGTVLLGWVLIGLVVPLIGSRTALAAARTLRTERGDVAQHVTDSIQGTREVVAFGYEQRRRIELDELGSAMHRNVSALGRIVALRRGLIAAASAALAVCVVLIGAYQVTHGMYSWQHLALALGLVVGGLPAVVAVEEFAADLDQAYASATRVAAITESTPVTPEPSHPVAVDQPPAGKVEIDRVGFTYPGASTEVLHDVSLELRPGTVTALVGASGSGKSTLAHLVVRFYDPSSGQIRIDGTDLRDLSDASLRGLVTIVGQRPYLFNASIAQNLRIAAPQASDEQLEEACRAAALDLTDFADGLATEVGEQGTAVSGGQRQRIAIARALLRDTPVLVLDEVTSQLDAQTEAELTSALRRLQAGRTTLVIAHRLSTIKDANTIAVVDAGRIVAAGTHAELMATSVHYQTLMERDRAL